ncbi:hypothetical protein NECID01_1167 [Nematocida sp. AWRm77]|nr:hypothetical protein NECID01_1167 [Nematocida sp. AWRm77]
MSVQDTEMLSERERFSKLVLSLSETIPSMVFKVLEDITQALERSSFVDLTNSEFLSILFLFNHRLSSVLATSVFQVLLKIRMTEIQVCQLFDWKRTEETAEDMYWVVNWSFLDKNAGIKQQLIPFLAKIAAKYTETIWDVLRTLFLLLDDENLAVRTRSYKGVYRVAKMQWRTWGEKERQAFRSGFRYFGPGHIKILRKECEEAEQRQKEAKIEISVIENFVKVHVMLGRKIRTADTIISICGKKETFFAGIRKHTFLYCKKENSIVCTVHYKHTLVARKEIT